jgi:hypothetical protein
MNERLGLNSPKDLSDNHTPYFSKFKSGTTFGGLLGLFLITWTTIKLREQKVEY